MHVCMGDSVSGCRNVISVYARSSLQDPVKLHLQQYPKPERGEVVGNTGIVLRSSTYGWR